MHVPEHISVEITIPERAYLFTTSAMALLPAEKGDMAILPRRAPLIASLKAGVVSLFSDEKVATHRIFIAAGFADVRDDTCRVTTREAMPVEEINRGHLVSELREYNRRLEESDSHTERTELRIHIEYLESMLASLTGNYNEVFNPRV